MPVNPEKMENTECSQKLMMIGSTGSDAWGPEILQLLTLCASSTSQERDREDLDDEIWPGFMGGTSN